MSAASAACLVALVGTSDASILGGQSGHHAAGHHKHGRKHHQKRHHWHKKHHRHHWHKKGNRFGAPTGLAAASPTAAAPHLSWKAVSGASQYVVLRDGTQLAVAQSTSYTDAALAQSGTHSYAVKAVNAAGTASAASHAVNVAYDVAAPNTPSAPNAASPSAAPALSWAAVSDNGPSGVARYEVDRDGSAIATTASTSYTDRSHPADGQHGYTVVAIDGAGNRSVASAAATVTVDSSLVLAVGAPTGLAAPSPTSNAPALSWHAPAQQGAGGVSYTVSRDGTVVGHTSQTSFDDTALSTTGTHLYTVSAVDSDGTQSAPSAPASVVYNAPAPSPGPVGGGGMPSSQSGIPLTSAMEMFGGARIPNVATAQLIARTYRVINVLPNQIKGYEQVLKQANPNLMIIVYVNGMFAQHSQGSMFPASWYLTSQGGSKIRSRGYGNYLMDPTSTATTTLGGVTYHGWTDFVAKHCAQLLAGNQGVLDGCFLDMLGTAPLTPSYNQGNITPWNSASHSAFTNASWMTMTSKVGKAVAAYTHKPVIGNGLGNGPRFFGASTNVLFQNMTGGEAEIWLRTPVQPATAYPSTSQWQQEVQMLIDSGKTGNAVVACVKAWGSGTTAQKAALREYALASFLIGNSGHDYFEFSSSQHTLPWNDLSPLYQMQIGSPTESYATVAGYLSQGVYQRDFTHGKVLVNPSPKSVTVSLGHAYQTAGGKTVSSITLGANTGAVLVG